MYGSGSAGRPAVPPNTFYGWGEALPVAGSRRSEGGAMEQKKTTQDGGGRRRRTVKRPSLDGVVLVSVGQARSAAPIEGIRMAHVSRIHNLPGLIHSLAGSPS